MRKEIEQIKKDLKDNQNHEYQICLWLLLNYHSMQNCARLLEQSGEPLSDSMFDDDLDLPYSELMKIKLKGTRCKDEILKDLLKHLERAVILQNYLGEYWYKEHNYFPRVELEVGSPSGDFIYRCQDCETIIIKGYDEIDDEPIICPHCYLRKIRNDIPKNWISPEDKEYKDTLKYLKWSKRYWNSGFLQAVSEFKSKLKIFLYRVKKWIGNTTT